MPITPEELERRLVEADRIRKQLRKATVEWQRVGHDIYEERRQRANRPERPDEPGTGRG